LLKINFTENGNMVASALQELSKPRLATPLHVYVVYDDSRDWVETSWRHRLWCRHCCWYITLVVGTAMTTTPRHAHF